MKTLKTKSLLAAVLFSLSLSLSGCNEDVDKVLDAIQNLVQKTFNLAESEVKKVIHPLPECYDPEVIVMVNKKLTDDALYGTHAVLKSGTIVKNGVNEQTEEKFCKAVVTYQIDEKDNEISKFFSKIPIIKNVSKDRTINYSVARAKDNESFIVHIK